MLQDHTQTAGYKIFHWKYQCKIPESMVYSDAVLENFGTFVSGDEARDISNATMMVGAIRTIAELAVIHSKGVGIELPNAEKTFEIYSIICQHLKDAIEFQRNGMFGQMPPMEDLQLLDKFAAFLYREARWHFISEEDTSSGLMTHLRKRQRRAEFTPEKTAPEAHTSLTAKLDIRALTGSRKWR